MSENKFDNLADRIRDEAAQAARPGQMERLEAIALEVEALRRGAKTLGEIVDKQCRMVLDVTGMHDAVDETGDGDWGAIWDHLYDIRNKALREAGAAIAAAAPAADDEVSGAVVEGYEAARQVVAALHATTTPTDPPRDLEESNG